MCVCMHVRTCPACQSRTTPTLWIRSRGSVSTLGSAGPLFRNLSQENNQGCALSSAQLRAVLFVITRNWRPESRNVVKFKISEASLGSVTITGVVIEFSNVAAASCYSRTVGGGVA